MAWLTTEDCAAWKPSNADPQYHIGRGSLHFKPGASLLRTRDDEDDYLDELDELDGIFTLPNLKAEERKLASFEERRP